MAFFVLDILLSNGGNGKDIVPDLKQFMIK